MFRLILIALLAFTGCKKDPAVMQPKDGELPPLPPASGTSIGYLVDGAKSLDLREDQIKKLKEIDSSLAARNDSIDTQLRSMEKPDEQQTEKGQPPPRHNNAPGAQVRTTGDAAKLYALKKANEKDSLDRAFAILDPPQQVKARQLLDERGISAPGGVNKQEVPKQTEDGVPLEP
ncbi:MAG: hypothetical protein H0V17_08665 [Deltaproteobacteria bacterium]|nr:hypothetical protein [Deltaproteobacteria bacterium]